MTSTKITIYYIIHETESIKTVYVGATNNFRLRKNNHSSSLATNTHRNKILQELYNTSPSIDTFSFTIISEVDEADAPAEEVEHIKMWQRLATEDPAIRCANITVGSLIEDLDFRAKSAAARREYCAANPGIGATFLEVANSEPNRAKAAETRRKLSIEQRELIRQRRINTNDSQTKLATWATSEFGIHVSPAMINKVLSNSYSINTDDAAPLNTAPDSVESRMRSAASRMKLTQGQCSAVRAKYDDGTSISELVSWIFTTYSITVSWPTVKNVIKNDYKYGHGGS